MNRRHKKILVGCSLISVSLLAVMVTSIVLAARAARNRIDWKTKSPHQNQEILIGKLRQVAPEAQLEDDTCGLHTLRAIYSAYGIDPDKENLRIRLGLDIPSNPTDMESTGTLQLDLLRVLVQDGFVFRLVDFSIDGVARELSDHLRTNMAAALIRRRQNGNLHWVALQGKPSGEMAIIDSLYKESYTESPEDFVSECALSLILVSPNKDTNGAISIDRAHYMGAHDMLQTIKRYREISRRSANGR